MRSSVTFHGPWADESRAAGDGLIRVHSKRAVERFVYRRASAPDRSFAGVQAAARRGLRDPSRGTSRSCLRGSTWSSSRQETGTLREHDSGSRPRATSSRRVRRLVPRMGIGLVPRSLRTPRPGAARPTRRPDRRRGPRERAAGGGGGRPRARPAGSLPRPGERRSRCPTSIAPPTSASFRRSPSRGSDSSSSRRSPAGLL